MIAVTGGGTGGHIFPNIAIIDELGKRGRSKVFWIGEKGGKEQSWAVKAGVPFYGIRTGKLRRYFSLRNFSDLLLIAIGTLQSFFILLRRRPSLLFSKGGFVSVPPVVASRFLRLAGIRIPVITHESDVNPGLATRIIARFASCVCVSFEKTRSYLPGVRTVVTGNPVREAIRRGDREKGLSFLGIRGRRNAHPVVLVLGGSLGARTLNGAVREMLVSGEIPFCLVHQCGAGNYDPSFPDGEKYRQFEFIDREMGDVLAAAALVVSRAGAGALYELGLRKKASILVPLPRSKSRGEQIENARVFEAAGAAAVIDDEGLNGQSLSRAICRLLQNKAGLVEMGEKAKTLCTPDAEKLIVDIIDETIGGCSRG
jgi:UDP-N-acetylglucosamine--N-acetylmuramyl-(pentapeptide) pyrophosphoryl-undecaprenol N-acetylglucosamine transferase